MRWRPQRTPSPVTSITTAAPSLADDQRARTRRYLIAMAVRTGCALGAIVLPGWPRWVLLTGAVVLPYLAVVAANTARTRRPASLISPPGAPPALPPGPRPDPDRPQM